MVARSFGSSLGALPGCFLLDRLEGIEPGTVTGVAVNVDAAALDDARAALGARLAPSGDDGAFRINGLPIGAQVLRVSEDIGDDGVLDRVAFRTTSPEPSRYSAAAGTTDVPAAACALAANGTEHNAKAAMAIRPLKRNFRIITSGPSLC